MLIANHALPATDPFSFTMAGRVWFAWEWLSDLILGAAHMAGGLPGVVLLAGIVIAATMAMTLRYMLWLGVNFFLAVGCHDDDRRRFDDALAGSSPHVHLGVAAGDALAARGRPPQSFQARLAADSDHRCVGEPTRWLCRRGGTVGVYGVGVTLEQLWAARQADGH
ncbi:MAG: hypothetical protein R2748_19620 [Bryobacterales bacterium]